MSNEEIYESDFSKNGQEQRKRDRSVSRQRTSGVAVRESNNLNSGPRRGKPKDQKNVRLDPSGEWTCQQSCQQLVIILTLLGRNIIEHKAGRHSKLKQQQNASARPSLDMSFILNVAKLANINKQNNQNNHTCVFFFKSKPSYPTYEGGSFIYKKRDLQSDNYMLSDPEKEVLEKVKAMLKKKTRQQIMRYLQIHRAQENLDDYIEENLSQAFSDVDAVIQATFTQHLIEQVKGNSRLFDNMNEENKDSKILQLFEEFRTNPNQNRSQIRENIMKIISAITNEAGERQQENQEFVQNDYCVGDLNFT